MNAYNETSNNDITQAWDTVQQVVSYNYRPIETWFWESVCVMSITDALISMKTTPIRHKDH